MPLGFSKACRTCLTLDGTLISIYDSISYDGRGRITDMIKDITKIKPMKTDGLPELVCQTCLNEINRCYSFKVKCLNSDSTLRKLFATEEDLETPTQQQVLDEEKEYKPIIQNLIRLHGPDQEELDYEPPVKVKTEKDQNDQSFGYFVITSVCSQSEQTNAAGVEETFKTFQTPQGYIKEEIDYEVESYNTCSTRRLTYSDQSQCFDNISLEVACPQVKLEPEDPIQMETPIISSIIKTNFKCPKCDKEFLYTSRLKKHMRSHNAKPFVCSTCSRGFKLSSQLRNHIDITHRNIKPFKCEECPRTFSFPSKLKEHLRSHKGSKYFKNNDYLSHTLIDKKENEAPSQQIAKHSGVIEYKEEQKPEFKSDEITKTVSTNLDESIKEQTIAWTNERSTRRSARIHREELKSPDSEQNQTEPTSSASETIGTKISTRLSEKLIQHVDYSFDSSDQNLDAKNSPEGPRQYNCPHCSKIFKYVSRLNEHMVCHSDARPFDCINCGKFFKTPGQLTRHIKTSHKVSSFRGHRKAFSRRRGLKRKNVNKNFVRNKVESDMKSLQQTDKDMAENENDEEQTNMTSTDPPHEHIIENENQVNQTNETNKDQSENVNKNELTNETINSLPENETKPTVASKNKTNKFDSPSKHSTQINKENASENLQTPAALEESYEAGNISTDEPRSYHCEQCDETFIVSARFYKHMRGHGVERPFICSLCGRGFKNCGNLKSHILITHKKLKPFKCNDCKRAFSCKSNLNKHLTSRIWTHSCTKEFNGRRGGSKKKIKNKKQLNIKEENKDLIINNDTSKQKQKRHIEPKNENATINDDKSKQKQKRPIEEVNTKSSISQVCAQEPDVVDVNKDTTNFTEPDSVEVSPNLSKPEADQFKQPHIESIPNKAGEMSVNKKPKSRLECPQCKKVFVYVSYLKKHMQSHSDERNFICTICDKAFKYKVSLKSHNMITHAKIKPYKCDKCPQAFVNEYTYRVHRNSHNKVNKKKTKTKRRRAIAKPRIAEPISTSIDQSVSNLKTEEVAGEVKNDLTSCSMCSISIQSENLVEHMQQYHSATDSTSDPVNLPNNSDQAKNLGSDLTNRFECPECKKVFLFASYLKKHMRSHNHERPHVCSTCGKAFKDHWRLRSHMKEKHTSHSKKCSHRKKKMNLNRGKPLTTIVGNADGQDQNVQVDETSEILNTPQENLKEDNNLPEKSDQLEMGTDVIISKEVECANVEIVKPQCTQCNRVFQFASQLETHMRTHTGERPFACHTCDKTFTQKGHLKNHILINHKKIMPFQCSVCLRGFASGFNMRAHEKTHFKERRKKVKSKKISEKLEKSRDEHSTADPALETVQNLQDVLQDQVIQDFEKLDLHPLFGTMSSNQDENLSNEHNSFYPCSHCEKTFVFHSDLNAHIKTHSANARPFNCSICYKTFKQAAHLKIHTQMSHTKTRNYKCSECDRVFLTFYILNKHMRSHKGKKNRSKAKSKRGYKKRVNYLQQTEYSEQLCTTEFGIDETNEQQTQAVSSEEVPETFNISREQIQPQTAVARTNVQITCALCAVSIDSDNLTEHMKQCLSISQSTSIQLKSEPLEDPQHIEHPLFETLSSNQDEQQIDTGVSKHCAECNKDFFTYSLLATHMQIHNVDRPFICTTCGKGFKKNAHLRSHIMIVHKRILPYKCIECARNFSSKYNLQMHLKTHIAKGNLKKGSSKRRVIVKKSYYKDPPYHAKPIHTESAYPKTTRESHQQNEIEEPTINYAIENQMEQREIQFSYGRNENKIRCTLCFVSVHIENLSKHMQEFHNLPESLTLMPIKKEPLEESELGHQPLETESIQTETSKIDTPRRLQCPTCDKEFIHLSRLNEHMRAHSDERPFICLVCGKTFKRHGHLTAHIAMCYKKAKPFKCKECQEMFSTSLDLNVHLGTCSRQELPTGSFVDTNSQNEINLEPSQNDESLPPSNIGAELIGECTVEEAHQCTLCPTVFKSISHLMEHMKVHTSDQPFICSLCGKGFSNNDDLTTHRLIRHNKSKPYQCDHCVRKFRTSLELTKHLLIHTNNSQRIQKLMRRKRQNKIHNLDPNNQEALSYSQDEPHCHICKKKFTNNWVLKEHMKCHTSERPFICPICGHGFSKKYNLKIHIMAHKKIKPFKCHYCPQSYCTNSGRTHHMRTHTHGRKRIDIDSFNSENFTL